MLSPPAHPPGVLVDISTKDNDEKKNEHKQQTQKTEEK